LTSSAARSIVRAVACLVVALFGAGAGMLWRHGARSRDYGWTAASRDTGRYVDAVEPSGPAAGRLAPGDRILAVDGDTRLRTLFTVHFFHVRPGEAYTLRVARDGRTLDVPLRVGLRPDRGEARREAFALPGAVCLAGIGVATALRRASATPGRWLAAAGLSSSVAALGFALPPLDLLDRSEYALAALITSADPVYLAVVFDLYSRSLGDAPRGPAGKAARALLYAGGGFLSLTNLVQRAVYLADPETVIAAAEAHPRAWAARARLLSLFTPLALAALVAVAARGLIRTVDSVDRTRAGGVVLGLVAGLAPALVRPASPLSLGLVLFAFSLTLAGPREDPGA
jgi:hypothetical protein